MKKKLISFLCTVVAGITLVLAAIGLSACGTKLNLLEENIIDDNYDNYYEIFVRSYYDSDGDGNGDLKGVAQKLDYLRDMGYTGIWLMPIMPSSSYHGYDVEDYYGINPDYGTLEDYENLLEKAHGLGIKVIIDLVVNHTSFRHPWFTSALNFKKGTGGDGRYADWYNFSYKAQSGYHQSGSIYYEGQFDSSMPDLNLGSAAVRAEIDNIIKFWIEKGTDGFRLDGCLYYYGKSYSPSSAEFCKFIKETAVKYNPNAYIVGEAWDSATIIQQFYESGADSFFYFPAAGQGDIAKAVNTKSALVLWRSMESIAKVSGDYIPAPFLSNHDNGVGRIAGRMGREPDKIKFAYGLLSMFSGNTFTYYGDEIGMICKNSASDPDLRVGMLWDNKKSNMPKLPAGANAQYIFDGVAEQLKDSSSIANYYKLCNNARNAFPALMRGSAQRIANEDFNILVVEKTYNGEKLTLVINLSDEQKTVEGVGGTLAQSICVTGKIKSSGAKLTMPEYSIAILT